MGEDVTGLGAIRNMQNPPAFSDPDRMQSALYHLLSTDNGGVHINSGVNNKAVYLLTDGGAFNGQTISALGMTKVARIYYEVQSNLLVSGSDYNDLYHALYQGCQNLIGTSGITAADCQEVREATLAVEMHLEPVAGFHPEAPVCTSGVPSNVFFDNMESGSGNWIFTVPIGIAPRWQYDAPFGPYAHSGTHILYADDFPAAVTDASATMSSPVVVPANAYLHFSHVFAFEFGYDGGVVEYTTNNGATWNDAAALFDFYGYPGNLFASTGNPLAGRPAFHGDSHGYRSARLNLASLAGQSVRFRWRMGLDPSIAEGGWLLDDVRIYTCGSATPSAAIVQLWPVSNAAPGATVPLWALVRNTGTVPLPAGTRVWYQVTGPSYFAWVGSTLVAGLAPGATAWYSFSWTIPGNQLPGNYSYRAQVWTPTQSISPLSGPQNFVISPISAAVAQLWPVSGARPGAVVPLWARVTNTSVVPLPANTRVYFLVSGPGFNAWVGSTLVSGLAPAATQWFVFHWTIPANAQSGNWGYRAQVWTPTQAISPLVGPQNFVMARPVIVTSLWPVSGAARGATVTLWARVQNNGGVPLPADARVWFLVTGSSYSAWVGFTPAAGLAAGGHVWYAFNWTIPAGIPLGNYGYRAQVWTLTGAISDLVGPQAFSILSFTSSNVGSSSAFAVGQSPSFTADPGGADLPAVTRHWADRSNPLTSLRRLVALGNRTHALEPAR
jgi:hypothetical protein